jgi:NAD(P)-dependent dehydrogenase (short-subunit alcohol dehydrogenase family)
VGEDRTGAEVVDVADSAQVRDAIARVEAKHGASTSYQQRRHHPRQLGGPPERRRLERGLAVNLTGAFHCCRARSGMRAPGTADREHRQPGLARNPAGQLHAASKAGLVGSPRLALELARFGSR